MADPLPPPDKDKRKKPNPNSKPSSPYEPWRDYPVRKAKKKREPVNEVNA